MCPGGAQQCPAAHRIHNSEGELVRFEECGECIVGDFEYSCRHTRLGQRIEAAAELDAALEMGLRVDFESLPASQFSLLKIIRSEKAILQSEPKENG